MTSSFDNFLLSILFIFAFLVKGLVFHNLENLKNVFDLRDGNNNNNNAIQFIVKSDEGQVIGVKPQITLQDTFKLFTENSFEYLYNANYISIQQKLLNDKQAKGEGLIPGRWKVTKGRLQY